MNTRFLLTGFIYCAAIVSFGQSASGMLKVKTTEDFDITGDGTNKNWNTTDWSVITQRDKNTLQQNEWNVAELPGNDIQYQTQFKILYSAKGVYCLFRSEDSLLTVTNKADNTPLYNEDVVEVFLKPDGGGNDYFEYELSPWNFELPLMIQNNGKDINTWLPYMYVGDRRVKHRVHIGEKNTKTNRFVWTAEIFIPYELVTTLKNVPPQKGSQWRANFYRIDYDRNPVYSSWSLTRRSYHDPEKFGTLVFE